MMHDRLDQRLPRPRLRLDADTAAQLDDGPRGRHGVVELGIEGRVLDGGVIGQVNGGG
jgi:hypothetical protein